jgi:hypothetical protein
VHESTQLGLGHALSCAINADTRHKRCVHPAPAPIVDVVTSSKRSEVKRINKQLLPTAESPTRSTCSSSSSTRWVRVSARPRCVAAAHSATGGLGAQRGQSDAYLKEVIIRVRRHRAGGPTGAGGRCQTARCCAYVGVCGEFLPAGLQYQQ